MVNQAGTNARFKGTGTINGTGSYQFMIWATQRSPNTFRIQVTDPATGNTVYDSRTQNVGGGSVIFHKSSGLPGGVAVEVCGGERTTLEPRHQRDEIQTLWALTRHLIDTRRSAQDSALPLVGGRTIQGLPHRYPEVAPQTDL